jgi:hypothetical protein
MNDGDDMRNESQSLLKALGAVVGAMTTFPALPSRALGP